MQKAQVSSNQPVSRYLIIAGEESGDILAADLVRSIQVADPQATFFGIGGQQMRSAGVATNFDVAQMAVVGLTEIIKSSAVILKAFRWVRRQLSKVDAVILVDYPGFNLRIARRAKLMHLPVFYYVSPTVWAWHASRIKIIKSYVDHMLVILPFEVALYKKAGVPVTLLRHPLLNKIKDARSKADCCLQYGLDPEKPILLLMPGSRQQELMRLWPLMQELCLELVARVAGLQIICAQAGSLPDSSFAQAQQYGIQCIAGDNSACMLMADSALCASGTATLELALAGVPMAVVYKMGRVTYALARLLIKTPHVALCNIVLAKRVAPEFLQAQANAKNIAPLLESYLTSEPDRSNVEQEFAALRSQFVAAQMVSVAATQIVATVNA